MNIGFPSALIAAGSFVSLLYLSPASSLIVFFIASAPLVWLRQKIPVRAAVLYQISCALFWVVILYFYIDIQRGLTGFLEIAGELLFGRQAPSGAASAAMNSFGASYCFLRAIYALRLERMPIWDYFRYYFFLPTFFIGPIMPPEVFLKQIPRVNMEGIATGMTRILMGVMRFWASSLVALMIPNSDAASMSSAAMAQPALTLWFLTFLAGVWLYLNFSGASEIAIGVARLAGIHVPENFNNPFAATNLVDFWRSWHITLGDWLRSNVFNPFVRLFSGKPNKTRGMILASMVVMLICGLWHQFTLSFLIWGAMHGGGLAFNQAWTSLCRPRLGPMVYEHGSYKLASWLLTHGYITLSWSFFFPAVDGDLAVSAGYAAKLLFIW